MKESDTAIVALWRGFTTPKQDSSKSSALHFQVLLLVQYPVYMARHAASSHLSQHREPIINSNAPLTLKLHLQLVAPLLNHLPVKPVKLLMAPIQNIGQKPPMLLFITFSKYKIRCSTLWHTFLYLCLDIAKTENLSVIWMMIQFFAFLLVCRK